MDELGAEQTLLQQETAIGKAGFHVNTQEQKGSYVLKIYLNGHLRHLEKVVK